MDQARELFIPMNGEDIGIEWDSVTPHQAVEVLKHLRDTGEVNWTVI